MYMAQADGEVVIGVAEFTHVEEVLTEDLKVWGHDGNGCQINQEETEYEHMAQADGEMGLGAAEGHRHRAGPH